MSAETRAVLVNLARRVRRAKRYARRAAEFAAAHPRCNTELTMAIPNVMVTEAWNSFQAAKRIVAEMEVQCAE